MQRAECIRRLHRLDNSEGRKSSGGPWCVVTLFIDFVCIMTWAQGIKGFKVSERRLIQNYEIDIMNFKVIN